ncbi:YcxB family protein [Clostridium sp. MSJ-4]|uniref:YcxB family protein n=1 Tax=Clostridium simiarum TaxID=2841506 RepID=A0ABS6F4I2_9CLOT|nr:YcxB family protein [Clostridium simiarum]MBU5593427.1 YcxB family protein [Clostridium simiarum]
MKISYKNTKEDLMDFIVDLVYNSEKYFSDKWKFTLQKIILLCLIIEGLIFTYTKHNKFLFYFIVLILILYIIFIITKPNTFKDRMVKELAKKTNKNIKEDSFTNTTLILSEEGISVEDSSLSYKTPWSNIEKAVITENHIFIYIKYSSNFNLFIIPLRTFNEPSEKESFLEIIRQHDVNIVNSINFKKPKGRKN